MPNLGQVKVAVVITDTLTNIVNSVVPSSGDVVDPTKYRQSFDFTAIDMGAMAFSNTDFPPRQIEITDAGGGLFSAIHPSRSFYQVNNYMSNIPSGGDAPPYYVLWHQEQCDRSALFGSGGSGGAKHIRELIADQYAVQPYPVGGETTQYNPNYSGPKWMTSTIRREGINTAWWGYLGSVGYGGGSGGQHSGILYGGDPPSDPMGSAASAGSSGAWIRAKFINIGHQRGGDDGIWWGAKADLNVHPKNVGFWLDIDRSESRGVLGQAGWIVVRINPSLAILGNAGSPTSGAGMDLVLVNGKVPRFYDWGVADPKDPTVPWSQELQIGGITESAGRTRIGIFPVCGRLVISISGGQFVYCRPAPLDQNITAQTGVGGTTGVQPTAGAQSFGKQYLNFEPHQVAVYGSNCQASINMSAMTFGTAEFALPVSGALNSSLQAIDEYPGSLHRIHMGLSPANLGGKFGWGVSTNETTNGGTTDQEWVLKNINYQGWGSLQYYLRQPAGSAANINEADKQGYYVVRMNPDWLTFGSGSSGQSSGTGGAPSNSLLPLGAPFVFRMRGTKDGSAATAGSAGAVDISDYVMAISENWGTSDRYHVEHTMDITLYNPNGKFNYLAEYCKGVTVNMHWDSDTLADSANNESGDTLAPSTDVGGKVTVATPTSIFTGATYGGATSETAGKETLTIHCEDYMALMDHTRLMNSPYYDGIDAFEAIDDLCRRAGVFSHDDTDSTHRYFLPSGYSWTQPKMRFQSASSMKDDMVEITKLCERIVYFDGSGVLHFDYLQGGIFGDFSTTDFHFHRMPPVSNGSSGEFNVILDEKKTEHKLMSSVNSIFIKSIDRLSNNIIMGSRSANTSTNRFPYRKQMVMETPVLGSQQATNNFMEMLIARMFKVPRGITFKTIRCEDSKGNSIKPTDMFDVDGDPYRCMTITRNYDASSNSLDVTITGEYFGGSSGFVGGTSGGTGGGP